MQCRQCTEFYAKSTVVCPRCGRRNDRSPLLIGIRLLAVAIFIFTLNWVIRASAHRNEEIMRAEDAADLSPLTSDPAVANTRQEGRP